MKRTLTPRLTIAVAALRSRVLGTVLLGSVLLGATLSAGCSRDEVDHTGGAHEPGNRTVRRLTLEATETVPETEIDLAPRIVSKIRASTSTAWKTRNTTASATQEPRLAVAPEFAWQYKLEELAGPAQVRIPGPFDATKFTQVKLHIGSRNKGLVSLGFHPEGGSVVRSTTHNLAPGKAFQTLTFDVPEIAARKSRLTEITVRLQCKSGSVLLFGLDLLWRSRLGVLPHPDLGPRLVTVGDGERDAVGISTRRSASTSFMTTPGTLLRFSFGVPGPLISRGSRSRLRVHVVGDEDGATIEKVYLLAARPAKTAWQHAAISLGKLGDQRVTATWQVEGDDQVEGDGQSDAVCAIAETAMVRRDPAPRRVLLITSDTHRGDHIGSAARTVGLRTPVIDELAARGVLFDDCLSTTNITNPSHVAMMTGVHPRDTGILDNHTAMADSAATLAEAFREAGFLTYAALSVRHLSDEISGLGQGFDRVSAPESTRTAASTIDILVDWIRESEGLPLFIWLHLFDPHAPYTPSQATAKSYYEGDPHDRSNQLPAPGPIARIRLKKLGLDGVRDLEYPRALYKAEITELDAQLRDLLTLPQMSDAVISFTSDHGEAFGDHGIFYAHNELYPYNLHVPMILYWPDAPAGVRTRRPVSHLDLGRTLLDLAGARDTRFPGANLVDSLDATAVAAPPRYAIGDHGFEVSVTHEGWHLQLRLRANTLVDGSRPRLRHSVELYYLPDDPNGRNDRSTAEFERARTMRRMAIDWLASRSLRDWRGGDSGDAATLSRLEALGYTVAAPGDRQAPTMPLDCTCERCGVFADADPEGSATDDE